MDDLRIAALEARVAALERRLGPESSPTPPPFLGPAPPPPRGPAPLPPPVPDADAAERVFGRRALPLAGAVLVALGLASLTGILLRSGAIGPGTQYGLAWGAVLLLVGAGRWRARAGDGTMAEVLDGLAALGAYLVVVSGRATFGLYPDSVALGGVVLVAATNLLVGLRRETAVHGWLGLAGAVGAAWMARERPEIALPILALGGAAGFGIGARRGWPGLAAGALLGALAAAGAVRLPESGLVAGAFLAIGIAAGEILRPRLPEERRALAGGAVLAALPGAAHFVDARVSTGYAAAFGVAGAILAALSFRLADRERGVAAFAGWLLALGAAPAYLPPGAREAAWLATGVGLAGAAAFGAPVSPALAHAQAGFALVSFGASGTYPFPEPLRWAGHSILGALALAGWMRRGTPPAGEWAAATFGFGIPLSLSLQRLFDPWLGDRAWTLGAALVGVGLLGAGLRLRRLSLRLAGWTALVTALLLLFLVNLADAPPGMRVALLLGIGVALLAAGAVYLRSETAPVEPGDGP